MTLVASGLFGGFVLLVAPDGFGGHEGLRIMIVHALLVVAGNAAAICLFNWLIQLADPARASGHPAPPRAVFASAVATTLALLVAGPPLAVLLI